MNRLLPALLAAFAIASLVGCGTVMQQSIVRARMGYPQPPALPILPLDPGQELVLQGGMGRTLTSLPQTGVLDDSAQSHLDLSLPPYGASTDLFFQHRGLFLGMELAGRQTLMMGGANIQADGWQFLAWTGFGSVTYSQDILYKQKVVSIFQDTSWEWSRDSSGMNSTAFVFSSGISALFGTGAFRPFVAAKFLTGPSVDGISALSGNGTPKASNKFGLSQAMLDAGIRMEISTRFHAFAGAGLRTFTDQEIPGADWKLYAGASIDLIRADIPPPPVRSREIRETPILSNSVTNSPAPGPAIAPKASAVDAAPSGSGPRPVQIEDAP